MQENALESVICEMTAILSRPQYVSQGKVCVCVVGGGAQFGGVISGLNLSYDSGLKT